MTKDRTCARRRTSGRTWWIGFAVLAVCLALAASGADPARAASASAVDAGGEHTCALTTDGGVQCWGNNYLGQLGDGTNTDRSIPVAVSGLGSGVVAVEAGIYHTCALTTGGGVLCWGNHSYKQLGSGTTTDSNVPVAVNGVGDGVAAIAAGGLHTCVLNTGGGVLCWGGNASGELGRGTTSDSSSPATVSGLRTGATAIAAGDFHSCAVTEGGGVLCWGDNSYGQLGDGTTTNSSVPVTVSGLGSGVAAVAAGRYHTCALTTGGGVLCWGRNAAGQLGDGTTTDSSLPVAVSGLGSGVTTIAAGDYHSCAVTAGGSARCWGRNSEAQLGDGTTSSSSVPVAVSDLASSVVAIAAGESYTCALTTGGGIHCWGANASGQLGNGTAETSSIPVAVSELGTGVAAVSVGGFHTCALTTTGGVLCWGYSSNGQLGDGTTTNSSVPAAVGGLGSGVAAVSLGGLHTCALTTTGGVLCWGSNSFGRLGDGTTTDSSVPVTVSGLGSGVAAIAAGTSHTCALTTARGVLCWGPNYLGQLGNGTTTSSSVPVFVSGLGSGAAAIAVGGSHTCALTTSGGVLCWGNNHYGQLGDGTTTNSSVPVAVSGLGSGVAAIAAGDMQSCALTTSGGVLCWGYNSDGRLGDGTTTSSSVPVAVSGLETGVEAIAAGADHTCALTAGGGVLCWGNNVRGELGVGYEPIVETPGPVIGFEGGAPPPVPALGLPALGLLVVALVLAGAGRTTTSLRAARAGPSGSEPRP